jgi:hypothetical protein
MMYRRAAGMIVILYNAQRNIDVLSSYQDQIREQVENASKNLLGTLGGQTTYNEVIAGINYAQTQAGLIKENNIAQGIGR